MRQKTITDSVVMNPYIMEKILRQLDIRSLSNCHMVSKDFFDFSAYESHKRKDIIHLYLLQTNTNPSLFVSFKQYTNFWLQMRTKNVFLLVGGDRQAIDYRAKRNSLNIMCEKLPKECQITYLDVGHAILSSSIRFRSLTNYVNQSNGGQAVRRTSYPCMSCLLIPHFDGVEVRAYRHIKSPLFCQSIQRDGVKCVLFFQSSKVFNRNTVQLSAAIGQQNKEMMESLMERMGPRVAFGGGDVNVVKHMTKSEPKEDRMLDNLVLTVGGHRVKCASVVLDTRDTATLERQLSDFKKKLNFDCSEYKKSTTIAIVFANLYIFSMAFSETFQNLFPSVALFGFQTNQRMFGTVSPNNETNGSNRRDKSAVMSEYSLDPRMSSVIVFLNFQIN